MALQTPRVVVQCKVLPPAEPTVEPGIIDAAALSIELDQVRCEAARYQAELAELRQAAERESQRHEAEVRAYKNERRIMEEAMRRTMTELVELRRRLAMFERSSSAAEARTAGVHRMRSVPPERVATPEGVTTPRLRSAGLSSGLRTPPPPQSHSFWVAEPVSARERPGTGGLVRELDDKLGSGGARTGGSAATDSTSTATGCVDGSTRFSEPTASPQSSPSESLTTTLGHMEFGIAEQALKLALQRSAEVLETKRAKELVSGATQRLRSADCTCRDNDALGSMTPPAAASRDGRPVFNQVHLKRRQSLPQQPCTKSGSTTPRESAVHALPRHAGTSPRIITRCSGSRSVPHGGAPAWSSSNTQRVANVVTVQSAMQAPSLLMVLPPPRRSPTKV